METLIRSARDEFPRKKINNEASINMGCSNYLLVLMATLHITLAGVLVSQQYVGEPLTCYTSDHRRDTNIEQACAARLYYLPVGTQIAAKYQNNEVELSYAFYRITHWILLAIGKKIKH